MNITTDLETHTTATTQVSPATERAVRRVISKRTFCTIASTSAEGHSHSAGVVYGFADGTLWVHTLRTSRKARNVVAGGRVGVCIPFRRLPIGPPFTIHFQATAELVAMDDPTVVALIESGALKGITAHGELEMPDGCFIRIDPVGRIHSFGPGARIIDLVRDPLNAGGHSFEADGAR